MKTPKKPVAARGAKGRIPNARQRLYLKGLTDGKSHAQAAREAGYSERVARHPGEKLMSQPAVRRAFAELLPPIEKLAERICQGVDAKRTEFAKHEGRITDKVDCVDFEQRRKYVELALNFHDGLEPTNRVAIGLEVNLETKAQMIAEARKRVADAIKRGEA